MGETHLPFGQWPAVLHNGEVILQTQSGQLNHIQLDSHNLSSALQGISTDEVSRKRVYFIDIYPS